MLVCLNLAFAIFVSNLLWSIIVVIKLRLKSDREITFHIHFLMLSNKNNTNQAFIKLNLKKIFSLEFSKPEIRAQVSFGCLDELISAEHQVRFLNLIKKQVLLNTQALPVQGVGFNQHLIEQNGLSHPDKGMEGFSFMRG